MADPLTTGRLGTRLSFLGNLELGGPIPEQTGTWTEPAAGRGVTWTEEQRVPTWTEPNRGKTWSAPAMTILVKRASEVRLYTMDLANLPEISGGDTVSSVTSISCVGASVPGAPSDLTLTSKAVTANSKGAQCKIAGGNDGVTYILNFTVLTAAGYTLVGIGYLYVDDR